MPVVRDLEALARALESPLDRVAWLAVLRAPFVGLSLDDLTVIAEAARDTTVPAALKENIPGLSPDGMERLLIEVERGDAAGDVQIRPGSFIFRAACASSTKRRRCE